MNRRRTSCSLLLAVFFVLASTAIAADVVPTIPITGKTVPQLAAFDDAIIRFMTERKFQAGVLAISRDGRILLEHGYGSSATGPVQPETPMRIASVAKPFTAAAIRKLIAEKKLAMTTPAFDLLDLKGPEGKTPDPRLAKITIADLLAHKGGWDREHSYDPMFADVRIRIALKLDHDPDQNEIIRYMLGEPLQTDPGTHYAYSNFGYCVLGRVVEKVTGKSYIDYIKHDITGPCGAKSIDLAHSDPVKRAADEVAYPPDPFILHMERMDSHGGLISTAGDLLRFSAAYWCDGQPRRKGDDRNYAMFGSLPCTTAMLAQQRDGIDIAVIFNGRALRNGDPLPDLNDLKKLMDATADSIQSWPTAK